MKKNFYGLALILLAFVSNPAVANTNNYFYVAAKAGIFQADFNQAYRDQTDIIPQNIVQTVKQQGYMGGIAAGYRQLICADYFIGAELSANLAGHWASFQSGAATAAFSDATQIKSYIDLVITPGLKLTNSIATYLKLGLSFAALQDQLNSPVGFTPLPTDFNSKKNALGLALGLGLEKSLNEHMGIFVEANYHDYGTIPFQTFQNFTATYTHAAHVYSYDLALGVNYKI